MNLNRLNSDQKSEWNFDAAVGKTISAIYLNAEDDDLHLEFSNGYKIKLRDDGQLCCESRYMRTDDSLPDYTGAVLLGAEVKDAPAIYSDNTVHKVQFLEIQTSKGALTMASHVEHNGYYGGFRLAVEVE